LRTFFQKVVFCYFYGHYLDFDFKFLKLFWTIVGLGLSFTNSGLNLDRKIWQSVHLCCIFARLLDWYLSRYC